MPKIVSISGTSRPNNYTSRALAVVNDELRNLGHDVDLIDARELNLAFPDLGEPDDVEQLRATVRAAAGVVFATPEYHGSFSAMTKLIIENLGFPSALRDKPVALVGVAAGRIGAVKSLEQLRSVCAHVGAIVMPGAVSVASVRKAFDAEGNCTNPDVESMLKSAAQSLTNFIKDYVCPKHTLEEMARQDGDPWSTTV